MAKLSFWKIWKEKEKKLFYHSSKKFTICFFLLLFFDHKLNFFLLKKLFLFKFLSTKFTRFNIYSKVFLVLTFI